METSKPISAPAIAHIYPGSDWEFIGYMRTGQIDPFIAILGPD